MQQDFTSFWHNNTRAYDLFQELVARMERGAYDDEYLALLDTYQAEVPDTPNFYIFAARYLCAHGTYDAALPLAERAYRLRPVNYEVWKLLAALYQALGRELDSITMQGYAQGLYHAPKLSFNLTTETLREGLDRLSLAMGFGTYAPLSPHRASVENNELTFCTDVFVGETLPLMMPEGSNRFYVGCYAEKCFLSEKGEMLTHVRRSEWFSVYGYHDFVFDLQKAREVVGNIHIEIPEGRSAIVPVAGSQPLHEFTIETSSRTEETHLGRWAFSYFRLDESTTLSSPPDRPYAVGTPILLGHSPKRKKLVLNILVDALAWEPVRTRFPACMPRIAKFFSRGVIFNQHFSTSEHTYPALPAIETGRYPHRTHIFNEKDSHEVPLDIRSVSECMKELGYYCAAPMASAFGVYNGVMRGYDRIIATAWKLPAFEGADRTIRHIEEFNEVDQFLFLHIMDVHCWDGKDFKYDTAIEVKLPLSARGEITKDSKQTSVNLPNRKIYQEEFWESLRHVDRNIGALLSYIEEHYSEDEYIVNLYSDHGIPVFDAVSYPSVVSNHMTHATWMIRGAGVPAAGVVDELTSVVDIYPTLGALCGFPVAPDIDGNLPAVFGGKERDVIYSASQFPGKEFQLAVRSKTHAFYLTTREPVDEDGTVDFAAGASSFYPREHELETGCEVDSEELRAFFYPRARDFVRSIASNGEHWPSMREARPKWFGKG